MSEELSVIEQIDKLSPLQRAVMHVLLRGRAMTAAEVFERLELFAPDAAGAPTADAVRFAVHRSLDRLVDEKLVERDSDRFVLARQAARACFYHPRRRRRGGPTYAAQ